MHCDSSFPSPIICFWLQYDSFTSLTSFLSVVGSQVFTFLLLPSFNYFFFLFCKRSSLHPLYIFLVRLFELLSFVLPALSFPSDSLFFLLQFTLLVVTTRFSIQFFKSESQVLCTWENGKDKRDKKRQQISTKTTPPSGHVTTAADAHTADKSCWTGLVSEKINIIKRLQPTQTRC